METLGCCQVFVMCLQKLTVSLKVSSKLETLHCLGRLAVRASTAHQSPVVLTSVTTLQSEAPACAAISRS